MKRLIYLSVVLSILMILTSHAYAFMGGGGGMGGNQMANYGEFGMMNGMAGIPVVGEDGTAYVIRHEPFSTENPDSDSFESTLISVTANGQKATLTLNGIVSRPVVYGGLLVATASLPDMSDYNVVSNLDGGTDSQSVLYVIDLPFNEETKPFALTLDGNFASVPVVWGTQIYLTTTDFGDYMMGTGIFNGMFHEGYDFHDNTDGKSYLYIINFDGTVAAKAKL